MTWNYRIIRYRDKDHGLGLHEVYYNDDEEPTSMTEAPITFVCDEEEGKMGMLDSLSKAFADCYRHPILNEPETWGGSGDENR